MKHYGMTVVLKDDPVLIEKYRAYHRAVWPEVEKGLKAIGITSMYIYTSGRLLFTHMETVDDFDFDADFARYMESDPRCKEWEQQMDDCMEGRPGSTISDKWGLMELIYEL